ncbi:hypothetical protein EVAR_98170_1 [Eumeta japonica]|uniref:Uncharacterized protein n=1 Tax=Eumeta variegata TaxID=151549 RepID=A0A4C1YHL6_EUMVA|nr:hypothetical protein EVAR_98170_1 [Eumeta japonica]
MRLCSRRRRIHFGPVLISETRPGAPRPPPLCPDKSGEMTPRAPAVGGARWVVAGYFTATSATNKISPITPRGIANNHGRITSPSVLLLWRR